MKRKTKRMLKDLMVVSMVIFALPLTDGLVHGNISILAYGAYMLNLYCMAS